MHDLDFTAREQGSVKRSEHFLPVWNSFLSQIYIHPTIKHALAPSAANDIKLLPRQSDNKTNKQVSIFIFLLFGYFWTTYWQNETQKTSGTLVCFGSEKCSKTQAQTIDHTLQSDSEH